MTNEPIVIEPETPIMDLSRQQSIFCLITVLVLAMLLFLHVVFASILGEPSPAVIALLGLALVLTFGDLWWLRRVGERMTERAARIESYGSIAGVFILTASLTYITNRDENPYFVLLAIPILRAAYMFGLFRTLATIAISDGMIFLWLWHFFSLHPPARITQYLEAWMLSVIYIQMGMLVWFLVSRLKRNQMKLSATLTVLRTTRERLISEEKLAAIGRLASGIAHEIRNPVAMISSSLATATRPDTDEEERKEMFAIAAQESKRLEFLTADFLTYARPTLPKRTPTLMIDLLSYIAGVTKAHAANRAIRIASMLTEDYPMEIDVPQVEGALLNLVLNAIDATPEGGSVELSASSRGDLLTINILNTGPAIPSEDLDRIFEPFFTTKPTGTGLGLAIARAAARAHHGDLWLSTNQEGCVTFSMTLAQTTATVI